MNIEALEKMLAAGNDNAMLRFTLGKACFDDGRTERAIEHLDAAVKHDPSWSAAWKWLGRALHDGKRHEEAANALRSGIAAAEENGDKQATKEMRVFLRRVEKSANDEEKE